MEDTGVGRVSAEDNPAGHSGNSWQGLWFFAHLAAVYALVEFCTPWLAGWTAGKLLPLLQHPTSSGPFQFLFSHIFGFSFLSGISLRLNQRQIQAQVRPICLASSAVILAFKFVSFQAPSVFASHFSAAFHQYFAGGFLLGGSWAMTDFSDLGSPDIQRGLAQLHFTAPLYTGVGYSIAAWIGCQTDLSQKMTAKVVEWEESRFRHHP